MSDTDVAALEAKLAMALERLGEAETQIKSLLAAEVARATGLATPIRPVAAATADGAPIGRRRALAGLAAAAAAGTVGALGSAKPAAAANGSNFILGSDVNTATSATGLSVQPGATAAAYGIGATDNGAASLNRFPALWGHAKLDSFEVGVYGQGDDGAIGVIGEGRTGVHGVGIGSLGLGLVGEARTQLHLFPNGLPSPPSAGAGPGNVGDIRWNNSDGALWACIVAGDPGTWRKVVGTGTAGALHLLPVPVRVYDTRPGSTPSPGPKTKLTPGVARTIDLKVNGSGVPEGTTGVLLTVLLLNAATGGGNLTVWANDQAKPATTMVWGGNAGRFTALVMTTVDAEARVKVEASLATDVALNVVGYYR